MQNYYDIFVELIKHRSPYKILKILAASLEHTNEDYVIDLNLNDGYLFAKGNLPVCLVAHSDVVFYKPVKNVYVDKESWMITSDEGLGADDRAGILAILDIVRKGYYPSIFISSDEESSSKSTESFLQKYGNKLNYIKFFIEFDRRGTDDCVFYGCTNKKFQRFIESFGFKTNTGTFSDISWICPMVNRAGVNLSVGYQNEHTYLEILDFRALKRTVSRVCDILDAVKKKRFKPFRFKGGRHGS